MNTFDDFLHTPAGRSLAWLADAPMFIDADQIAALYNAVARPEHETARIVVNFKDSTQFQVEGSGSVQSELAVASWLTKVFPFLDAKAGVSGELGGSRATSRDQGNEFELRPNNTPQRQLVQLALHYFGNLPERTRVVSANETCDWLEETFITSLPRALVFVDCPPRTMFIPMAVEIDRGSVHEIYPDLVKSFERAPTYPEPEKYKERPEELAAKRKEYWTFFRDNFSSTIAMQAIERKVSQAGGAIRWIAYRVPLSDEKPYLHVNVSPQGRYDTGIFAYRFVKRGFNHGLRIVATMKSEPAMNVLAVFEK